MYQKLISAQLCPSTIGQAAVDALVNPPKEGEPSYQRYNTEKMSILTSLAERAKLVTASFNSMDGVSSNPVQGALYAFPRIHLPPKAIEAAKQAGQPADTFYTFQLLEETGMLLRIWTFIFKFLICAFSSFRNLRLFWQRIWSKTGHISFPNHNPTTNGQTPRHVEQIWKIPSEIYGEIQVKSVEFEYGLNKICN